MVETKHPLGLHYELYGCRFLRNFSIDLLNYPANVFLAGLYKVEGVVAASAKRRRRNDMAAKF